jgi:uncharacterized phage protein (TIGR01671 family)
MRSIKFRAHHPDSGMKYFILNQVDGGAILFDDGDWRRLNDCEVMQFTGIYDKNGKEIYEGDVVKLGDNMIYDGILCEVVWLEKLVEFCYKFLTGDNNGKYTDMLDTWRSYEVIGDIYENSELLKEEK